MTTHTLHFIRFDTAEDARFRSWEEMGSPVNKITRYRYSVEDLSTYDPQESGWGMIVAIDRPDEIDAVFPDEEETLTFEIGE